jgi:hypothetical protein
MIICPVLWLFLAVIGAGECNNNAALHHIENKFNKILEPLKVK